MAELVVGQVAGMVLYRPGVAVGRDERAARKPRQLFKSPVVQVGDIRDNPGPLHLSHRFPSKSRKSMGGCTAARQFILAVPGQRHHPDPAFRQPAYPREVTAQSGTAFYRQHGGSFAVRKRGFQLSDRLHLRQPAGILRKLGLKIPVTALKIGDRVRAPVLVRHKDRKTLAPVDPCHPVERKMPVVVQQRVRFGETPLGQKYPFRQE